ncbi:piggyBac transposable element-derived protein 4-like [Montipora capricornis]|uniref:piggyBac transposable element-derived protein 4-like n=1 Tax=Montipora capricornis TaxID=246305 RepID=UPI0035F1CB9B
MAAFTQSPETSCGSRSDENDVEIQFIDEDELPLACISVLEHPESEEEIGLDDLAESSGDESEESESEEDEDLEEEEQCAWSEEINRRNDVDFNEFVGLSADVNLRSLTSSKGFFDLFFTDQVWELLVTQTNLYANQKRGAAEKSVWYPVSVEEMKGWVAVYLCMGIVNKPNILSYWSTDPILSTPFFGATMSRTRFLQILRYLHFVDNSQAPEPDSPNYNKLYKIQPLLDLIIPRFRGVYKPERELAVDETLIKFKGKIHFRQFIPIKPGRFGIKAFTLAESTSGYVLGSKVYTGKEANVVQKDLGKRAVMLLMEPFLDKGYYVFMDNYYTSVGLFEELEGRKTLACGTVRSNRLGLPKDICDLKAKEVKSLKRGESLYRLKDTLTCVTWCDRKPVSVLGTVPTSEDDSGVVERSTKTLPALV